MQLSTLKLFFLTLLVSISSAAFAQTAPYQGDGTKEKPYLIQQFTANEDLLSEIMVGKKIYIIGKFVGYGVSQDLKKLTNGDHYLLVGDTTTVKLDENDDVANANLGPRYLVANDKDVAQKMRALEQGKTYEWYGTYTEDAEAGDLIFTIEDVMADPTSVAALKPSPLASKAVYDLSGRLVQAVYQPATLPQGLYIVGGAKVLVR